MGKIFALAAFLLLLSICSAGSLSVESEAASNTTIEWYENYRDEAGVMRGISVTITREKDAVLISIIYQILHPIVNTPYNTI